MDLVEIAVTGWGDVKRLVAGALVPYAGAPMAITKLDGTAVTIYVTDDPAGAVLTGAARNAGADGVYPGFIEHGAYLFTEPADGTPRRVHAVSSEATASGTGTSSRQSTSFSTASLAAGAGASGTVPLAKGWRVVHVSTNRPARVRLYTTAAKREADVSRAVGVAPIGDHGCMFEVDTTAALLTLNLGPQAIGNNMEAVPSAAIAYRVENLDTVTGVVTVTLIWQQEES